MSAVILFPENNSGYDLAKIYRADSDTDAYGLIATVPAYREEYVDTDGDYSKLYKVAWSDGTNDSTQVSVTSFNQKIISHIRIEMKITSDELSDSDIDFLLDSAKADVMADLCQYVYGYELTKLEEGIYQIPSVFYFDRNFGGKVSVTDIDLFKQVTPVYVYSDKIPVTATSIDTENKFIRLEPLDSNEILKMTFYYSGRRLQSSMLNKIVAHKIYATYYDNQYMLATNSVSGSFEKIRIGDITIQGGKTVSNLKDSSAKANSRYNKLITNYKTGFKRVN